MITLLYPMSKMEEERKADNRERQRRYREKHGWVARSRQRESMRRLRAERRGVTTAPVNNEPVMRDNTVTRYGELEYGEVEGVDVPYEGHGVVRREGERVVTEEKVVRGKPLVEVLETEEERRVAERLKELVKRQGKGELDRGVDIPLEI